MLGCVQWVSPSGVLHLQARLLNLWMVREAYRFWKYEGLKGSARGLFWASVWHLPAVMVLAMMEKKGMWQRVWKAVSGAPDDEEWEEIEEEEFKDKATAASSV